MIFNKKFFIKKLILFLIPILIPMFLFGVLSVAITQSYVKDEINKNNITLLQQVKENVEIMFGEMDSLNLNIDSNPGMVIAVKQVLKDTSTLENVNLLGYITNFFINRAGVRPFIHSVYVYFNNSNNLFISSTNGLTRLDSFQDTAWYKSYLSQKANVKMWVEQRYIRRYSFEKNTRVVSFYKTLYSPGMEKSDGVIVLNVLPSYVENSLNHLLTYKGQCIFVVDDNSQILFNNSNVVDISSSDIEKINKMPGSFFTYTSSNGSYIVSKLQSQRYGWKYISVIPRVALYSLPMKLSLYLIFLLALSAALGILITFFIIRRNYKYVRHIAAIFQSAEAGRPLPALQTRTKDEYGYIIQNILKAFIEQNYLKVQLSEKKYKMQAIELMALQAQLNPHFLFNTLETIYWETVGLTGKPNIASQQISNLSKILAYSLEKPSSTVTVEEEIRYTKSYIEIQKYRCEDRFNVLWDYDNEANQYQIMKLLLQPLIENSIQHGFRTRDGYGRIKIKIRVIRERLLLSIVDNGIGISKDRFVEIKKKIDSEVDYYDHIGLINTYKRFKLTYGENCSFHIRSKPGLGTAIYISFQAKHF